MNETVLVIGIIVSGLVFFIIGAAVGFVDEREALQCLQYSEDLTICRNIIKSK